jgi:hypothetical protein
MIVNAWLYAACVRACVRARVYACMRACARVRCCLLLLLLLLLRVEKEYGEFKDSQKCRKIALKARVRKLVTKSLFLSLRVKINLSSE